MWITAKVSRCEIRHDYFLRNRPAILTCKEVEDSLLRKLADTKAALTSFTAGKGRNRDFELMTLPEKERFLRLERILREQFQSYSLWLARNKARHT